MKYIIASDIHGSAFYCEKLLDAFKKEGADKLILLGDILYHGPRNDLPFEYAPKKVIEMLNNIKDKIVCVRGNCDAEVDQMVLDFPIRADYKTFEIGNKTILLTHGHLYDEANHPIVKKGDIIIHGHTHIPRCDEINGIMFINPGSTSIPKANSQHSYMVLENETFIWKNLEGEEYKTFSF